jgi:carbon storage regulator CsrA
MLCLTRKSGESIKIGKDVEIFISRVFSDGRVRVAISAPDDVEIIRGELGEHTGRIPSVHTNGDDPYGH